MPWSESSSGMGTKAAEAATWRWDVENGRAGDASGLDHLGLFLYTRVFHCNRGGRRKAEQKGEDGRVWVPSPLCERRGDEKTLGRRAGDSAARTT